MKERSLTFFLFIFSVLVFGQNYTPIDDGSKVHFVVKPSKILKKVLSGSKNIRFDELIALMIV